MTASRSLMWSRVALLSLVLCVCCGGLDASSVSNEEEAYFSAYGQLDHQVMMLQDMVRMRAYHTAIMNNSHLFEGKVVLDVGCGTGILSLWAAQAGARRVYAVEARYGASRCDDMSCLLYRNLST